MLEQIKGPCEMGAPKHAGDSSETHHNPLRLIAEKERELDALASASRAEAEAIAVKARTEAEALLRGAREQAARLGREHEALLAEEAARLGGEAEDGARAQVEELRRRAVGRIEAAVRRVVERITEGV